MNAIKSGRILEQRVFNHLKTIPNIKITPQYSHKDIFGANARIDFLVQKKNHSKFFIECKNQNVKGSLDQKFSYYLENIRQQKYNNHPLIFVLNTKGIRPIVLDYLVKNVSNFNYLLVDTHNINKLKDIINEKTNETVFINEQKID